MKPKTKKKDEINRDPWMECIDILDGWACHYEKHKNLKLYLAYGCAANLMRAHMPKLGKNRREK
jgi:hypothetical protein